jgi:hypothetical protein
LSHHGSGSKQPQFAHKRVKPDKPIRILQVTCKGVCIQLRSFFEKLLIETSSMSNDFGLAPRSVLRVLREPSCCN